MKVSVIIPAYNMEQYIARTLDSIINQDYKDIEIIVIDDGSTDNTKKIINEYAKKDNRIRPFYSKTNKGVSATKNIGLKQSTGEYIIFVDSDDELIESAIRIMVDAANKYNSDYVDSYHLLYYQKKNKKIVSFTEHKLPKEVLVMGSLNDNIKVLDMYTYVTGKLIKRELVRDIKFDESISIYEDVIFEHELKTRIKNYVFLDITPYLYYQRENSLVNTFGKKHLSFLEVAKKVRYIYRDYNKDIKDRVDALLFHNIVIALFFKAIKNDDSLKDNVKMVNDSLSELISIFDNYQNNKYINKIIKRFIKRYYNSNKLERIIKRLKKKDFVKLYFNYLSVVNKYKI